MNVNDEMDQLGKMGSVGYSASDTVVDQLHARTRRARSIRRGSAVLVGSLGAMTLGVFGASAVMDLDREADAGTVDRTGVEKDLGDKFDSKYSNKDESDVDLDKIFEEIDTATETETEKPKKDKDKDKSSEDGKEEDKDDNDKPKEECEDYDYGPDKPYKYYDCSKGEWRIKAGWYWDQYADDYAQCGADGEGAAYEFGYYDCDRGKWVPATGWVVFHDTFAQCKAYSDAATGTTFNAGLIKTDSWHKMVSCNPSEGTYGSEYRYVYKYGDAKANVSGTTCTGVTTEKKGAPFQYSCNPKKDEWQLADSDYKWFKENGCSGWYFHKDETVEWGGRTYEWIGGKWVDTTPEPEPDPSPSSE